MARVTAPFMSTYAAGSIKKTLTCIPLYNDNTFKMQLYKRTSGKRHKIQVNNARIFRIRSKVVKQAHINMGYK